MFMAVRIDAVADHVSNNTAVQRPALGQKQTVPAGALSRRVTRSYKPLPVCFIGLLPDVESFLN